VQEGAIGESHNARTCNLVTGAVAVAIPNSLNNASLDDIRRYLYLIEIVINLVRFMKIPWLILM
jgi:hypothetical protein